MGRTSVVLHYYKLIGRNNYPLLLVLILNLVLGVESVIEMAVVAV